MKFTYLVYKQVNGTRQLAAATQEEWDAILKKNRRLPLEQRRRFMKDCIEDGDEVDCMYIEVPASEHREWNSKNTIRQKNRKLGMRYTHQSLDAGVRSLWIQSRGRCSGSGSHRRTEMCAAGLAALGGGADGSLHGRGKAFLHKRSMQKIPSQ